MEGQVFILVIMVVAGLVSMVKKAIAEEKKKQEALIRAAQARKKQAAEKNVPKARGGQPERIRTAGKQQPPRREEANPERREGVDPERRRKPERTGMEGLDQEQGAAAERERLAKAALQPMPPVVHAVPEQPEQLLPFDPREQLQDKSRVLELFVLKEVLDKPVALRRK